jgi:hypothetical protein
MAQRAWESLEFFYFLNFFLGSEGFDCAVSTNYQRFLPAEEYVPDALGVLYGLGCVK